MRLEHIPLILGVVVALIGLALIADAWMGDDVYQVRTERRRRIRAERHHLGEAILGLGTLCMAAALLGRDNWRYGTLAVLIGTALLIVGAVMNRRFLKEAMLFRGVARRGEMSGAEREGGGESHAKKAVRPPGGRGGATAEDAAPPARSSAKPAEKARPSGRGAKPADSARPSAGNSATQSGSGAAPRSDPERRRNPRRP